MLQIAELQDISDSVCRIAGIKEIPLRFTKAKSYGGMARYKAGYIAIPEETANHKNEWYQYHVIIHEVCHFIHKKWHKDNGNGYKRESHGYDFKNIEEKYHSFFGMQLIYNRAFAEMILDDNDVIVWRRKKYYD